MSWIRLRKSYRIAGVSESFARWFNQLLGSEQRTLLSLGEHLFNQVEQGNIILPEPEEEQNEETLLSLKLDICISLHEEKSSSFFAQSNLFTLLTETPYAAETAYMVEKAAQTLMRAGIGVSKERSLVIGANMVSNPAQKETGLSEYEAMEGMIASRRQAGQSAQEMPSETSAENPVKTDIDIFEAINTDSANKADNAETEPEPPKPLPEESKAPDLEDKKTQNVKNSLKGAFTKQIFG